MRKILLFGIILLSILNQIQLAESQNCTSVEYIFSHLDECDKSNVTLFGEVNDVLYLGTEGYETTFFVLNDTTGIINVTILYNYTKDTSLPSHLPISEGDTLTIKGIFFYRNTSYKDLPFENTVFLEVYNPKDLFVIPKTSNCTNISNILLNGDICNGKNVTVTGKVVYTYVASIPLDDQGYTKEFVFFLTDDTNESIFVGGYGNLYVLEGNIVTVSGIFYTSFTFLSNTSWKSIIFTEPSKIIVKKNDDNIAIFLFLIAAILISCIFGFLIYSKYKKSHYKIGLSFERYILSLFDEQNWIIVDYTKDLYKKFGRKVESDSNPDIVIKHKNTQNTIAVECKYRSGFTTGKKGKEDYGIFWAKDYQIKNYVAFKEKTGYPVFIIIGVGNIPSNPTDLYIVPLAAIMKYEFATKNYLEKYRRQKDGRFIIDEFKY